MIKPLRIKINNGKSIRKLLKNIRDLLYCINPLNATIVPSIAALTSAPAAIMVINQQLNAVTDKGDRLYFD